MRNPTINLLGCEGEGSITLLDLFAKSVCEGILRSPKTFTMRNGKKLTETKHIAEFSYEAANELLVEREKYIK